LFKHFVVSAFIKEERHKVLKKPNNCFIHCSNCIYFQSWDTLNT